jgi:DNA-directed RNA polymerase specialized sigma24 family protein
MLRYRDGLGLLEIGERLGMSAAAVAKALQRARDALRECIMKRRSQEEHPG